MAAHTHALQSAHPALQDWLLKRAAINPPNDGECWNYLSVVG